MNAMPAVTRPCGSGIRPRHSRVAHPAHPPRRVVGQRPAPLGAALRLTRRGRVVAAAVAALLVTVVSLLAAGAAQATNHALPPGAARQNLLQVIVRPGQSLWSVAESTDPNQDTRAVVQQIVDLNALSGDVVFAGQQLWVPRG
jgi:LysM domain